MMIMTPQWCLGENENCSFQHHCSVCTASFSLAVLIASHLLQNSHSLRLWGRDDFYTSLDVASSHSECNEWKPDRIVRNAFEAGNCSKNKKRSRITNSCKTGEKEEKERRDTVAILSGSAGASDVFLIHILCEDQHGSEEMIVPIYKLKTNDLYTFSLFITRLIDAFLFRK